MKNVLATEKKIKLVKSRRCDISIEPLNLPNFQMLVMNCDNNNFYRTICTVFELLNHRFSCQRKRVKFLKFVFIVSTRMYTGNTVSMLD